MINEDKISRTAEDKEKEGVFTGLYVINPINNEKVPLWTGNKEKLKLQKNWRNQVKEKQL